MQPVKARSEEDPTSKDQKMIQWR